MKPETQALIPTPLQKQLFHAQEILMELNRIKQLALLTEGEILICKEIFHYTHDLIYSLQRKNNESI